MLMNAAARLSRRLRQFGWRDAPSTWGGSYMSFGPRKSKPPIEVSNGKEFHHSVEDVAKQFHRWRCARDLNPIKTGKIPILGTPSRTRFLRVAASSNKSVNRTPKRYAFWFPPVRSGAGYVQRSRTP